MIELYEIAKTGPYAYKTGKDKFFLQIQITQPLECWEFIGPKFPNKYGRFTFRMKEYLAHRVSYFIHFGFIDDSKVVMHSCDNPSCVNPGHLTLGTISDNVQDMLQKGRNNPPQGSRCGMSKLSEEDVNYIFKLREQGLTHKQIATYFPVRANQIGRILDGTRWSHMK